MMRKTLLPFLFIVPVIAFVDWSPDPATRFLESLNPEQLAKIQSTFGDTARQEWHFLPGAMWPRPGLQLGELSARQEALFFELLQVSMSKAGYTKTLRIMGLEQVLIDLGGDPDFRDPGKYHIEFYGDPARDENWAWSFEGHHIALHFTFVKRAVSMAPRFFGANPATIPSGDRAGERTLANEEDLAFDLIRSMSAEQRETAIFKKTAFRDIVTSNASQVSPLEPVGIAANEMSGPQQTILTRLLQEYLSSMPEQLATKRMQSLQKEDFGAIRFGWAGALESGRPHYYRIQGKSFLVEFDNIQNDANHIHTVWRDFDGDFGRDLLREHYESHHK